MISKMEVMVLYPTQGTLHKEQRRIFLKFIKFVNLFKAKHMYTCDFFPKKMFIFMGFFHLYGFGMVTGLILFTKIDA